jgi:hypothetical protein
MQYSPKLKKAMEEIKQVFSKYDLGGIVVIHEPGFSEYLYKIDPSYSAAKLMDGGVRITARAEQYGGDKEKRNKAIADTSNLLMHIAQAGGRLVMNTIDVSKQLDAVVDAEHTGGGHSSHTEQNN